MKTYSSSLVATVGFSKFADILSAVVQQPYLLGFEIVQLEFHHLHQLYNDGPLDFALQDV